MRVRERNEVEVGSSSDEERPISRTESSLEYATRRKRRECLEQILNCKEEIIIKFDGACRGNGGRSELTASAAAVFCDSYDSEFTTARVLDVTTNNAAEINGAILATGAVHQIVGMLQERKKPFPKFVICGDSEMTIAAVKSGRVLAYKSSDKLPNSKLWVSLAKELLRLPDSVPLTWRWVPRHQNVEPDELCNAKLDSRPPDPKIVSLPSATDDATVGMLLENIVRTIRTKRMKTIRTIPISISKQLRSTMQSWCSTTDPHVLRLLFFAMPRLISVYTNKVSGRADFKYLMCHVTNLSERHYLLEAGHHLLLKQSTTNPLYSPTPKDPNFSHIIATLCSRGLHGKVIAMSDTDTILADAKKPEVQDKLLKLFPTHQLPSPLPKPRTPTLPSIGALIWAFKRLKKGSAPGITGWTKELLQAFFHEPTKTIQDALMAIFTFIVNADISMSEKQLLQHGVLIPFEYHSAVGKIRPIQLLDVTTKMAFLCVMRMCPEDPRLVSLGFVNNIKGSSVCAVAALQAALLRGDVVVSGDAVNAFNTANRQSGFQYVYEHRNIYEEAFPLLNMLYAEVSSATSYDSCGNEVMSIQVSAGTRQGCVSGPWFLSVCTMNPSEKHYPHLIQMADDVSITGIGKTSVCSS